MAKLKNMKQIYPNYYPGFRCIASACRDSCCIGWEIDIDGDTFARYQAQPGAFGARLRGNISEEETPHFLLKGERCPFLNDKNLCDIILTLGEGALCEICDQHPRFHEWFGDVKESGVGLCCEAAARLIVENEAPAAFLCTEIDEEPEEDFGEEGLFRALSAARELLWRLLQDRGHSIWERLSTSLRLACVLQDCLDGEAPCEEILKLVEQCRDTEVFFKAAAGKSGGAGEETLAQILSFFLTLEPIDPAWPRELEGIREDLGRILGDRPDFMREYQPRIYEYEHLAVYFAYRYLLKAVYSGDVLSKVKLMAVSIVLLSVVDTAHWRKTGAFSLDDRVQTAKNYSKEIEYCEENLLAFWDASWERECFSTERLLTLLEEMGA